MDFPPCWGKIDARLKTPFLFNGPSMVEKQDAGKDQSSRGNAAPRAEEGVSVERATESVQTAVAPANHRPRWKRTLAMGVLAAVVLAAIWKFGVPWIELTLNTVSTDDAYVNGHVTFVAARVSGQIAGVLVDDNNRVHKGDVLAQLDREPYEVASPKNERPSRPRRRICWLPRLRCVALKHKPGAYWQLQYAMEDVENRVALLHARVAALDKSNATLKLAQLDFARAEQLLPSQTISRQEYDRRQAALSVAQAEVTQAMAGCPSNPRFFGPAGAAQKRRSHRVPTDLDQTFASVRDVQAGLDWTATSSALAIRMNSYRSRCSSSSRT